MANKKKTNKRKLVKKVNKSRTKKRKRITGGDPNKQNWTIPNPEGNNKTLLFWVEGFGCGHNGEEIIDYFKNKALTYAKIPTSNTIFVCHKHAIGTIIKTALKLKPLINSNFLELFKNAVIQAVNATGYDKILIFGFSYGGAIVNRLAQKLNEMEWSNNELSKIFMATFGSIYIPDFNQPKTSKQTAGPNTQIESVKVSIVNYLAKRDVAIICNGKQIDKNIKFNKRLFRCIPHYNAPTDYKKILDFSTPEGITNFTLIFCLLYDIYGNKVLVKRFEIHRTYMGLAEALLSKLTNNILDLPSEIDKKPISFDHVFKLGAVEEEEDIKTGEEEDNVIYDEVYDADADPDVDGTTWKVVPGT